MKSRHNIWGMIVLFFYFPIALFAQTTFTSQHYSNASAASASRGEYLYERQHPLRETRAIWLTTIGGLDWPRVQATDTRSRERQKQELVDILDNYKKANINTVIFQTRVRAALMYPSKIEPWELSLTGTAGRDPGYDPLAFCIEECHKRGMEIHCWVVCIPIGTAERQAKYGSASIVRNRRELVKTAANQEMFMIPGRPETADYIASICKEIVENYDVDGISLDYIRYPESTFRFSDEELYSSQTGLSKSDWKRENITRIVRRVHDVVKPIKPWVKLSSSPIGKYRSLPRFSTPGWNCYDAVWQDPKHWLEQNYQDLLFPMMYYKDNNFYPFLFNWKEISAGHPVIPGLGIYFLDPREGRWVLNDVRQEMHTVRNLGIGGLAFYRGEFFTRNFKGIYDTACDEFFPYPALTSQMTWMGYNAAPSAPSYLAKGEEALQWGAAQPASNHFSHPHNYLLYNVYSSNVYPVDVTRSENLIAVNVRSNQLSFSRIAPKRAYYAVTAIDRFGNESAPIQEAKPEGYRPRNINVPRLINRDLRGTKSRVVTISSDNKKGKKGKKK